MKRKLACILMALLLAAAMVTPALAAFDPGALDCVVSLQVHYTDDEGAWIGLGTGFFIGEDGKAPQYLVTNHHVIEGFLINGGGYAATGQIMVVYESNDQEEAYVVDYDETMDLAVLRLGSPTNQRKPLKLMRPTSSMVGSTVYAVGYPAIADRIVDIPSVTMYGRDDATVTTGSISRLRTDSGTGLRRIQTDANIHGGNSGGPLINDRGCVVGVNSSGVDSVESLNFAVSVEELIPILKRNNVPYVEIDPEPEPDSFPWMIVGIAAAVVAAIVIVIVIIVVASGKKKPPVPVPDPVPVPPTPVQRPSVRSMSRQHGGMQVPVDSQGILIGRDVASCKIVFQSGTPGVSSRHCSVAWDGASGEFLLTDLRSTYGTFLANGQRVTPGVATRLRPGDSFYLGERDNAIRVELG